MKKTLRDKNKQKRNLESLRSVLVVVFVVIMFGTLGLVLWQKWSKPLVPADYEGRIVDRWADYYETREGSMPRLRLVVETQDGKRLTVKVEPTVYESAKVGMRIRSRAGQIVLIESGKENER